MTDLLASGVRWLRRTLAEHAAQTITYIRGTERVQIPAVFGESDMEDLGGDVIIQSRTHDFLIDRDDLVLAGQRAEPTEGDRIEWLNPRDSQRYTFDVMTVGVSLGNEAYRTSDAYATGWRVHTRLVSVA